jgi:hypothetical protein
MMPYDISVQAALVEEYEVRQHDLYRNTGWMVCHLGRPVLHNLTEWQAKAIVAILKQGR